MGSEYKFILFLVLAAVFFVIYLLGRKAENYNPETFPAIGVIERINQNDVGDTWYYIKLIVDGKEVTAKTDSYQRTPKNTCIGETVKVRYNYTVGGNVSCYIEQEGFERVIGSAGKGKPISLYCACAFFLIFVIFLIKFLMK